MGEGEIGRPGKFGFGILDFGLTVPSSPELTPQGGGSVAGFRFWIRTSLPTSDFGLPTS